MPEIQWFVDNGCELTSPSVEMFREVHLVSRGDPCRECNCKDTCPAWPKLNQPIPVASDVRSRCPKCHSLLNMQKVERRGGKCHCGQSISDFMFGKDCNV